MVSKGNLIVRVAYLMSLTVSHKVRRVAIAIGVVVGARGVLSTTPNCSVDLDFAGPLTESANLYQR
jgi:hypothetical protein